MKKNYNVPATEIVAFVGGMLMDTTSPGTSPAYPPGATIDPGAGGEG